MKILKSSILAFCILAISQISFASNSLNDKFHVIYNPLEESIHSAEGIAVDNAGNLYVASKDNKIIKYDNNGTYIKSVGTAGSAVNQFNNLKGIAMDTKGYLYVADMENHRLVKLNPDLSWNSSFGQFGVGDSSEVQSLFDIAIAKNGDIYVSDELNNKIIVLDSNLQYKKSITTINSAYGDIFVTKPLGIDIDKKGNIYIVGFEGNTKILVLNEDLSFKAQATLPYKGIGVVADDDGNVYISNDADNINYSVAKYNTSLQLVKTYDNTAQPLEKKISFAGNISISGDKLYVTDLDNNRIVQLDFNLQYIRDYNKSIVLPHRFVIDNDKNKYIISDSKNILYKMDCYNNITKILYGDEYSDIISTKFEDLNDIVLAPNGNIYLTSGKSTNIYELTTNLEIKKVINNTSVTSLTYPESITADSDSNLYIANTKSKNIVKLNSNLSKPQLLGEDIVISDIAVDEQNHLYIANIASNTIQILNASNGKVINTYHQDYTKIPTVSLLDLDNYNNRFLFLANQENKSLSLWGNMDFVTSYQQYTNGNSLQNIKALYANKLGVYVLDNYNIAELSYIGQPVVNPPTDNSIHIFLVAIPLLCAIILILLYQNRKRL